MVKHYFNKHPGLQKTCTTIKISPGQTQAFLIGPKVSAMHVNWSVIYEYLNTPTKLISPVTTNFSPLVLL